MDTEQIQKDLIEKEGKKLIVKEIKKKVFSFLPAVALVIGGILIVCYVVFC